MEELNRISAQEYDQMKTYPVILLLDHVRSMNNVGSVFRTADAFHAEAVYLCGMTPRPPHRDIQKTALGATESVPWTYVEETTEALRSLKQQGYHISGVEQTHRSIYLDEYTHHVQKRVLVFGHEVEGISEEALALCDDVIEIPQFGSKHSLNISVSVGIVLWALRKS